MTPTTVVRGQQNVDGRITGANFAGLVVVDLGPGLNIVQTEILSATEFKVVFHVAMDAPPGPRSISMATAAGKTTFEAALNVIENLPPVAAFTASAHHAFRNEAITFDASDSSDPDGKITKYTWAFGDGASAEGKTTQHKYDAAGDFQVTLTVTDNYETTAAAATNIKIEKAVPPVARYTFSPHAGFVTTQFEFDGSPSSDPDGRIVRYLWDFGDGAEIQGKIVRHKFTNMKEFKVKLTVWDNDNLQDYVEKFVEVRGAPPVARFIASPRTGQLSTTFRFESISTDPDGSITSHDWNFGDGNTAHGKIVSHRYTEEGRYMVGLTVTDNDGLSASDKKDIRVTADSGGGGGGDGGGGGGDPDLCSGSNFRGQSFRVVGVSGLTITANVTFQICPGKCGEIRRDEVGIREFVGDARRFSGNQVTFDPGSLPESTRPEVGETLRMIWKHCH